MRWLAVLAVIAVLAVTGWLATAPKPAGASRIAGGEPDLANGRTLFFAGGCSSCHALPGQGDRTLLGGGVRIASPAGTFTAPNISPDPDAGIGRWSLAHFAAALTEGVSPAGEHYYPAFPYTTYRRMTAEDVRDLYGFLRTLPPSANVPADHDFPLGLTLVRRGMGFWKMLHLTDDAAPPDPARSLEWNRGAYLVEALGHCAECHSPRDLSGGLIASRLYAGTAMPGGTGRAPNITSSNDGIGDWSEDDIAFMLADGSTPEGDVVGGEMAEVVKNTAELSEEDRRAIAAYVKSLPPLDD